LRGRARNGARGAAILLEVQLRKDHSKNLSWPLYWAATRARSSVNGGIVSLLVITTHLATERWATALLARVIPSLGHWAVIGPTTMARITAPVHARRDPESALLSGLIHAGSADQDLVPALATACSTLSPERGILIHDAIVSRLSKEAVRAFEAHMQRRGYQWQSEFALRHRAEGRAEGRTEGRVDGVRRTLIDVIESRGLRLDRTRRATIEACSDLRRLQGWTRRAATAEDIADVISVSRATRRLRKVRRPRSRSSAAATRGAGATRARSRPRTP
jgi:hypothetical protein